MGNRYVPFHSHHIPTASRSPPSDFAPRRFVQRCQAHNLMADGFYPGSDAAHRLADEQKVAAYIFRDDEIATVERLWFHGHQHLPFVCFHHCVLHHHFLLNPEKVYISTEGTSNFCCVLCTLVSSRYLGWSDQRAVSG